MFSYRPFGIPVQNPHEREDPREAEREQATPILDHIYSGPAWRMGPAETISGAFRVIFRCDAYVEIGNGENPETCWIIFDPELLERAI